MKGELEMKNSTLVIITVLLILSVGILGGCGTSPDTTDNSSSTPPTSASVPPEDETSAEATSNEPDMTGDSFKLEGTEYVTIKGILRSPSTYAGKNVNMILISGNKWTDEGEGLVFFTGDDSYSGRSDDFLMVIPKSITSKLTPMKDDIIKIQGTIVQEFSVYSDGRDAVPAIVVSDIELL
jgi:hypothetical protein